MKQIPSIVYLTGGICSGKSSVREAFERLDVPCIDADRVAHTLYGDRNSDATHAIKSHFPSVIDQSGCVDRKSLRSLIASDPDQNRRLVALMTPHVMKYLLDWTTTQDYCYVIWESAIVVKANASVNRILVVDVDPNVQMDRLLKRNPDWSLSDIHGILSQQMSRADRIELSDDVIDNNGNELSLKQRVAEMHSQYLSLWKNKK